MALGVVFTNVYTTLPAARVLRSVATTLSSIRPRERQLPLNRGAVLAEILEILRIHLLVAIGKQEAMGVQFRTGLWSCVVVATAGWEQPMRLVGLCRSLGVRKGLRTWWLFKTYRLMHVPQQHGGPDWRTFRGEKPRLPGYRKRAKSKRGETRAR